MPAGSIRRGRFNLHSCAARLQLLPANRKLPIFQRPHRSAQTFANMLPRTVLFDPCWWASHSIARQACQRTAFTPFIRHHSSTIAHAANYLPTFPLLNHFPISAFQLFSVSAFLSTTFRLPPLAFPQSTTPSAEVTSASAVSFPLPASPSQTQGFGLYHTPFEPVQGSIATLPLCSFVAGSSLPQCS